MKAYTKNYVGKGTQVKDMEIVKVTLNMDQLLKYTHEFKGREYATFEEAKLQEPNKFGRTHTAYVSTRKQSQEA